MLYPAMSELLKHIDSRYLLVNVVANRARQISAEAEEEGIQLEKKPVTTAIEEVAEGKITAYVDDRDNIVETDTTDPHQLTEDEIR